MVPVKIRLRCPRKVVVSDGAIPTATATTDAWIVSVRIRRLGFQLDGAATADLATETRRFTFGTDQGNDDNHNGHDTESQPSMVNIDFVLDVPEQVEGNDEPDLVVAEGTVKDAKDERLLFITDSLYPVLTNGVTEVTIHMVGEA